jgi:hypothetical protein
MNTVWVLMSGSTREGGQLCGIYADSEMATAAFHRLVEQKSRFWGISPIMERSDVYDKFATMGQAWVSLSTSDVHGLTYSTVRTVSASDVH